MTSFENQGKVIDYWIYILPVIYITYLAPTSAKLYLEPLDYYFILCLCRLAHLRKSAQTQNEKVAGSIMAVLLFKTVFKIYSTTKLVIFRNFNVGATMRGTGPFLITIASVVIRRHFMGKWTFN